jgi:hypothetical protein
MVIAALKKAALSLLLLQIAAPAFAQGTCAETPPERVQGGTGITGPMAGSTQEVQDPAVGLFDWPAGYSLLPNAKMEVGSRNVSKSAAGMRATAQFVSLETLENVIGFYQRQAAEMGHKVIETKSDRGVVLLILLPDGYLSIGAGPGVTSGIHFQVFRVQQ